MAHKVRAAVSQVRPPMWDRVPSRVQPPPLNLGRFKDKQHAQLERWRAAISKGRWAAVHADHFDWWMWPLDDGSRPEFNLRCEADVRALRNDEDWLAGYREGVAVCLRAWGWDAAQRARIDPLEAGMGWTNWDVRLAKMVRSLWLFEEVHLFASTQAFARAVHAEEKGGRPFRYGSICLDEILLMQLPRTLDPARPGALAGSAAAEREEGAAGRAAADARPLQHTGSKRLRVDPSAPTAAAAWDTKPAPADKEEAGATTAGGAQTGITPFLAAHGMREAAVASSGGESGLGAPAAAGTAAAGGREKKGEGCGAERTPQPGDADGALAGRRQSMKHAQGEDVHHHGQDSAPALPRQALREDRGEGGVGGQDLPMISDQGQFGVRHEEAACRFTLSHADGSQSELCYSLVQGGRASGGGDAGAGILDIWHTGTPPAQRGQGHAARLCDAAFAHAARRGLRVRPTCSYVRDTYLAKCPQGLELVEDTEP